MILKVLLVVVVIGVVYFMFIKKKPIANSKKEDKKYTNTQTNDMLECEECGVYCDIDEMILSNSKYYCSQECLEKS